MTEAPDYRGSEDWPKAPRSTVLSGTEEAMVVAFRRHTLRLHTRVRRTRFPAARSVWLLRISRELRGEFCADRLRFVVAEMPSSGCLLRRTAQQSAHGPLCPAPDRRQGPRARYRSATDLREPVPLSLYV